jgi:hypothetical protein
MFSIRGVYMKQKFCVPFVIDDKPYCLWDDDVPTKNMDLLNRIDPEYFEYIARVNFDVLEDEKETDKKIRQRAAIALRTGYSHGLEALFSLLCAATQAPNCIVGWLLKYQNVDLENVVRKINENQFIYSRLIEPNISWKMLARVVFSGVHEEQSKIFAPYIEKFSNLWAQFAYDFLSENFRDEYNNFKHGLRFHSGGFYLAMGRAPNAPITPENIILEANSEFGTTFFKSERMDKHNFVIHQQSRNWNPENYFHALNLISTSMQNILAFLKAENGADITKLKFSVPEDLTYFETPWEKQVSVFEIRNHSRIKKTNIPLFNKEQILDTYKKTKT